MQYIYIVLILFISTLTSQAQPGYQGKKFSINYAVESISVLDGPNYKGNNLTSFPSFNYSHLARLEYVLTRKTSIGLTYSFFRTAISQKEIDIAEYPPNYDHGRDDYIDPEYIDVFQRIYVQSLGLNYRVYGGSSGNLAPMGNYADFETQLLFWSATQDSVNTHKKLQSGTSMLLGVGFGRQVVAFDRLLIDFGIRFRIIPGFFLAQSRETNRFLDDDYDPNEIDFTYPVLERLSRHQAINFRIGIGFLAF
ncbi:hypothetical protein RCC89_13610 [Cytophagaceae bacterium ABcell3]|nr:hypothetical protein RCC89_13610 [Cytophagaceae bacterium ABcell3]